MINTILQLKVRAGLITVMVLFLFSCSSAPVKQKQIKAYPKAVLSMNRGVEWYDRGCYQKAIQFFWDAHEQFSAMDSPGGVAASYNGIGNAKRHLGEIENAILFLNQSLGIYDQLEEPQRQVKVLADISTTYLSADDLKSAEDHLQQAEKISQKWDITSLDLILAKGIWLLRNKDFDQALSQLLSAEDMIESDNWTAIGTINSALGAVKIEKGEVEAARMHFSLALDADRQSGFYQGMAENLSELGQILANEGDSQKSLFYLQRSIKIYALLGDKQEVARLVPQIESLAKTTGQDVSLTLNLAKRWVEGEVQHRLCE